MKLVNETNQQVYYWIQCAGQGDCGTIDVDGLADLPGYDNQQDVVVSFLPLGINGPTQNFSVNWPSTKTDEQSQITLVAE
jgi:hypothetical protein